MTEHGGLDAQPEYGVRLEDDELVEWFWICFKDSEAHFQSWREEIRLFYAMYAGANTLSDTDTEWLEQTKRPLINVNYTLGTLNTIIGAQMSDRKEIQFRGVETQDFDGVKAEWQTILARTAFQHCHGHRKESDAALDMLITGYGWNEAYLDTGEIPIPVRVDHVPPWEMYPDPDAIQDNIGDSSFLIRRRYWALEECQARWPDKKDELAGGVSGGQIPYSFPAVQDGWQRMNVHRRSRVPIYEFQYYRTRPWTIFVDPQTGDQVDMPSEVATKTIKQLRESGVEVRARHDFGKRSYQQVFITGDSSKTTGMVLERRPISVDRFTYNCTTGYKERNPQTGRCVFFGPCRTIVDLQKYINRSMSVYLEILARGAKGGFFIEKGAVGSSPEEFEKQAATPGGILVVEDGAISEGKIKERGAAAMPHGIDQFLSLLVRSFEEVTGVTDFLKGTANQERSNVLVSNMQQQTYTMLAPLYDPITQFQILNGQLVVALVLRHYTDEQINTILSGQEVVGLTHEMQMDQETGQEQLMPLMDEQTGQPVTPASILREVKLDDYEVTADVGQASVTQKQQFWNLWVQTDLIGTLMNAGVDVSSILPEMIRYMPIPSTLAGKLGDNLQKAMEERKKLETSEGILEILSQMPPEEVSAVIEQAMAMVPPPQPGEGGPSGPPPEGPPPGGPPPEGPPPGGPPM